MLEARARAIKFYRLDTLLFFIFLVFNSMFSINHIKYGLDLE